MFKFKSKFKLMLKRQYKNKLELKFTPKIAKQVTRKTKCPQNTAKSGTQKFQRCQEKHQRTDQ